MNITKFLNKVYFAPRLKEIEQYTSHAGELQQLVLQRLVRTAANTEWGKKHDYASIRMKISRSAFPYKLTKK